MELSPTVTRLIRWAVAIAAGLFLAPVSRLSARQRHKAHAVYKHAVRRKTPPVHKPVKHLYVHHYTPHHYNAHAHTRSRHRSRHYRAHRRRARIHLESARIKEIQEALANSGFFHKEPTGEWDSATRHAMQQYQEANGFPVTGLPEAKPLMKLGLGPHPLPPGLQPPVPANAGIQNDTEASDIANSSPVARSSGQAQ